MPITLDRIITPIQTLVANRFPSITAMVTDYDGGWEGWLQVELSLALDQALGTNGLNMARVYRERRYRQALATSPRTDLLLTPANNPAGPAWWIELKVQTSPADAGAGGTSDIINRFVVDLGVLQTIRNSVPNGTAIPPVPPGLNNRDVGSIDTLYAIAVIPSAAPTTVNALVQLLQAHPSYQLFRIPINIGQALLQQPHRDMPVVGNAYILIAQV